MKVAGIIAEYNPFHLGHAHQIRVLKESGFDYVIVCMSGDFVQRGAPAIVDKFTRARMALSCGADLVLELPSLFAVSSAEYFATAGVRLLAALRCVDSLCFGYEGSGDRDIRPLLCSLADYLNEEPSSFSTVLGSHLRNGLSYPAARSKALSDTLPEAGDFLSRPNNILAVEYTRAIRRHGLSLSLLPIPRTDDGYHGVRSAEGIRALLFAGEPADDFLPPEAAGLLQRAVASSCLTTPNDFSSMLLYRLLREEDFTKYADCSRDLSKKLLKVRSLASTFSELVSFLKTKDLTYTRISRVLINILLDHRQETLDTYAHADSEDTLYAKVLGFRRDCSPLLSFLRQQTLLPLISKCADASNLLSADAHRLFSLDIHASKVYHLIDSAKTGIHFPNDFEHPLEII